MKKSFALLILLTPILKGYSQNDSSIILKTFNPESQHTFSFQIIGQSLNAYHYGKVAIDNKLSGQLLDNYFNHLDPLKVYFTKSDSASFEKYRNQLDEDLVQGNCNAGFEIYNVYQSKAEERIKFALDLLKPGMDFNKIDSFQTNREKAAYVSNIKELDDLWKRKIKYEVLTLKADGKSVTVCVDIIKKRYTNLLKQMSKTKNEDVFSFYVNALTEIADPHTNYFSPRMAEDFNMQMSLNLEGIGATLQTENEYTKVREVVKGGPADKSKKISANDKIVAVGQGKDGEMVNILDWRIDDVVALIRGKKGTTVRLEIIPHDATDSKTRIIEIVRDKIVLEDQASKCSIKEFKHNGVKNKYGIINIPTFYLDFAAAQRGDRNFKSTTRDVRRLLDSLKGEKINGLIIDLRNNGGGSLQEAIELTGLFIKKGPVVQVKDANDYTKVEEDRDSDVLWDGPMVVLVNRFSASASEIFAAALQDYGRAIIIGEQTYGKGTVQNMVDMNSFMQMDNKKMGQLKMTIAKFYRISGGSTQHKGVIPDISFPSAFADAEFGEDASKFSLPYDEIKPADYSIVGNIKPALAELDAKHQERLKTNDEYKYLVEDIALIEKNRNKEYVTLNEDLYKKETKENEARNKERTEARKKSKDKNGENADLILDEAKLILSDYTSKK